MSKPQYIHEAVADPSPTQSFVQPTSDNKTHIVYFKTPFPNRISYSQTLITKIELSHQHTDDCTFCTGLRGNSPAPGVSVVKDVVPRKYRSVVKAVLFPIFLLFCAEMLQWGWSIALSLLRDRGMFEAYFTAHTIIKETQAEVHFVHGILFAVLAIIYIMVW